MCVRVYVCVCTHTRVLSPVQLFETPLTVAHQAPLYRISYGPHKKKSKKNVKMKSLRNSTMKYLLDIEC